MRIIASVALSAALLPAAAEMHVTAQPAAPLIVQGVVADAHTGAVVRRVRVRMTSSAGARIDAVSDREGRFRLVVTEPGRYTLTGTKAGYWQSSYGQVHLAGPAVALDVPGNEASKPLTLAMWRGGVIAGRVTDEHGDPAVRAEVRLLQSRYLDGARRLVPISGRGADFAAASANTSGVNADGPAPSITTDDLGTFRIYNVPPGRYFIAARSTSASPFPSSTVWEPRSSVATFFPNTVDASYAQPVDVVAGQETARVTISLAFAPAVRVRGRIVRTNGEPFHGFIDLRTRDEYGFTLSIASAFRPDGTFEIGRLAPGTYRLVARSGSSINAGAEAGTAVVTVNGTDVEDVLIVAGASGVARGRIVTDDGSPFPASPSDVVVSAVPVTPAGLPDRVSSGVKARVTAQSSFEIDGLLGEHLLRVQTVSDRAWTVRSIDWRGADIADRPIAFPPDAVIDGITVVMTRLTNEIYGIVTDARAKPTANARVVMFPADEGLWSSGRFVRATQTDRDGTFRLSGLPPLDSYLITAIPLNALAEGDWQDPAQLGIIRPLATPLTLTAAERKRIDLQVQSP